MSIDGDPNAGKDIGFEAPTPENSQKEHSIDKEKAQAYLDAIDDWQTELLSYKPFLRRVLATCILSREYSKIWRDTLEAKSADGSIDKYDQISLDSLRKTPLPDTENEITAKAFDSLLKGVPAVEVIMQDGRITTYITHYTKMQTAPILSRRGDNGPEAKARIDAEDQLSVREHIEKLDIVKRERYEDMLTAEQMEQAKSNALEVADQYNEV